MKKTKKEEQIRINKKQSIRERGITLVALIISIIILLILAGITLNTALSENGLFKRAKITVEKYKDAGEEEQNKIEELEYELDDRINGPVPEGKYYSIRNGINKKYYETLKEAYEDSVDNGGKNGGGTIVVERDKEEDFTEPLSLSKTITIDTNEKTVKISIVDGTSGDDGVINAVSGTLTLEGNGKIECEKDKKFICGKGGNIVVNDNPTISGVSHAMVMINEYSGELDINGGKIISTERGALRLEGKGAVTIDNAEVIAERGNKNAIVCDNEKGGGSLTISGNTKISVVAESDENNTTAISWGSPGKITINKGVIVEGPAGINLKSNAELEINDATVIADCISTSLQIRGNNHITINGGNIISKMGDSVRVYKDADVNLSINNSTVCTSWIGCHRNFV